MVDDLINKSAATDSFDVHRRSSPSIVAVPRRGVHRLCGELVGLQRGGPARTWRSQRVGAVQSGGRGAVTGGGALIRLVLQDDTNTRTFTEGREGVSVILGYLYKINVIRMIYGSDVHVLEEHNK